MKKNKLFNIIVVSILLAFSLCLSIYCLVIENSGMIATVIFLSVWAFAIILFGLKLRRELLIFTAAYFAIGAIVSFVMLFIHSSGLLASFAAIIYLLPYSGASSVLLFENAIRYTALVFNFVYSAFAFVWFLHSKPE